MYITYPYTLDIDCIHIYTITHMFNIWYIDLQNWVIYGANVAEYTIQDHTWIIWVISNYITRFRIFRTIACSEQLSYTGSMNSITPRQWVRFDSGKTSWFLLNITRQQGRFCTGFLGQSVFWVENIARSIGLQWNNFPCIQTRSVSFYCINGWFHWLYASGILDQCCKYCNKYAETTNPTNPCVPVSLCSMLR